MRLPEIAVRRPVTTVMVFAGIALLGTVAFFRTNLDMLPDISPPAISVITTYPGASATDVESEVTKYSGPALDAAPSGAPGVRVQGQHLDRQLLFRLGCKPRCRDQ